MTEVKLVRRNWRCEKHRTPGCEVLTSAGRLQKSDALFAFELWKRDICFPVSES